jgi:hypothetical protein
VRDPWQRINGAIQVALENVTLADLAKPLDPANSFVPLVGLGDDAKTGGETEPQELE